MSLQPQEELDLENAVAECEFCGGAGETSSWVLNNDSHELEQTSSQKCICQIRDEDYQRED